MAGYIIGHTEEMWTPTAYLSSSASSDFPHTNIGNRYPHRPWKSSAAVSSGTTYVGVDFGGARTMAAVFIDTINLVTIEIQGASDSSFTTSVVGSGNLTVSKNIVSQRYKLFYVAAGAISGASRRYWRILARTSATNDGESSMNVGSVVWLGAVTEWAHGTGDYSEQPIEATRPNDDFDGGGSEPVVMGHRYAALSLSQSVANRTDMRTPLMTLLAAEGIGRFFVFYENNGDTSMAYRVRRAVDAALRRTGPNSVTFQGLTLEESV